MDVKNDKDTLEFLREYSIKKNKKEEEKKRRKQKK